MIQKLINTYNLRFFLNALLVYCALSVVVLDSHAVPSQLLEDYVLSEQSAEWINTLPLDSSERIFFEVLKAQSLGNLKGSAEILELAENRPELKHSLQKLKQRQLLLEITQGADQSLWDDLIKIAGEYTQVEAYVPPRRDKGDSIDHEDGQSHLISMAELYSLVIDKAKQVNQLSALGALHYIDQYQKNMAKNIQLPLLHGFN